MVGASGEGGGVGRRTGGGGSGRTTSTSRISTTAKGQLSAPRRMLRIMSRRGIRNRPYWVPACGSDVRVGAPVIKEPNRIMGVVRPSFGRPRVFHLTAM